MKTSPASGLQPLALMRFCPPRWPLPHLFWRIRLYLACDNTWPNLPNLFAVFGAKNADFRNTKTLGQTCTF